MSGTILAQLRVALKESPLYRLGGCIMLTFADRHRLALPKVEVCLRALSMAQSFIGHFTLAAVRPLQQAFVLLPSSTCVPA